MNTNVEKAEATLEMDPDGIPDGTLTSGVGFKRRFHGWIELAEVIEDWRALVRKGRGTAEA